MVKPEERYIIGDNGECYVSVAAMKEYALKNYATALVAGSYELALAMQFLIETLCISEIVHRSRPVAKD